MQRLPFNDEELIIILEAARIALTDAEIFDVLCDQMDLAEAFMFNVRDSLNQFMECTVDPSDK